MVLGNHDLHLLAVHAGVASLQKKDTLRPILEAPDCEELIFWLRHQALLHREGDDLLVHAGILPQWSLEQAQTLAHEVETALRSDSYQDPLATLYQSTQSQWKDDLSFEPRVGFTTNVMTRMRVCSQGGEINLSFKGQPKHTPSGYSPWYAVQPVVPRQARIFFGHWSALGPFITEQHIGLDGGCVWGHQLMAFCLEDRKSFQVSC